MVSAYYSTEHIRGNWDSLESQLIGRREKHANSISGLTGPVVNL